MGQLCRVRMICVNYDIVIFDFDGTVADTGRGITNCVKYALEKLGKPVPEMSVLKKFVGPPLFDSFRRFCSLTDEEAMQGVALYRERYSETGLFEADIYPGITPLVQALKAGGAWVAVASGKPTQYLKRIIEHFGLTEYFDGVAGPDMTNHSSDKTAQVLSVLPENADLSRACMVGDRCFDVDAGKRVGMHTVAVEYGYGSREEFEQSGADTIVADVAALTKCLLGDDELPRGRLITFEGTDGCGKSTQMKLLADWLTSRGYEVVTTREPGGCPISEKIRELLLSLDSTGMSAECEALLYAAARVEHVKTVILPALKSGKIVLSDRFLDSSIAYQAYGRELGEDFVRLINSSATDLIMPDRTLMFDVAPETARERLNRGAPLDRLEREHDDFFARVALGFARVAESDPDRVVRIDSGRPVDEVFLDVLAGGAAPCTPARET